MPRRAAILLALALAALLGAAAWLALRVGDRPTAAGAPELEAPARVERAPAALAGAGATPERARAETPPPARAGLEPPASAPALADEQPERWILEGRVVGAAPERWEEAELVLEWVEPFTYGHPSTRRFALDGPSFALELGFLPLRAAPGGPEDLDVGVDVAHPALVVERASFSRSAGRVRRGAAGRLERVSTVVLVAHPGATLRGQLVDERGAPAAGARVELLEGPASGAPDRLLARTRSDARGAFTLSALAAGARLLLVDAEGRVPLALPLDALAPGPHELGTLVVQDGAALEGRVEGVGGGVLVVARLDAAFDGTARPGARSIAWRGSTPLRARVETATVGEGLFRIAGLAAEPHHLEVGRAAFGSGCTLPGTQSGELPARAPASGLVLRDLSAWLRFELRGAGETLVDGARVLALPSEDACAVGVNMRATWRVPPGRRLAFRAEAFGHAPAEIELVAPGPGERQDVLVELTPREGGRIVLLLRDAASGEPVRRIRYERGERLSGGGARRTSRMQVAGRSGRSQAEDGRHRLGPFDAGPLALRIEGDEPWTPESPPFLPAEVEVDVPASGEREYELALELGGRLLVHLRAPDGSPARAAIELRDARGASVHVDDRYVLSPELLDAGASSLQEPGIVLPPLKAGSYALEVRDEAWRPATIPVTVERGRTTTVEHELVPR